MELDRAKEQQQKQGRKDQQANNLKFLVDVPPFAWFVGIHEWLWDYVLIFFVRALFWLIRVQHVWTLDEKVALGLMALRGIVFVDERASKWEIILFFALVFLWLGLLLRRKCNELGELSPLKENYYRSSIDESDWQFEIEPHSNSIPGYICVAVDE